jgi:hypothetical protein
LDTATRPLGTMGYSELGYMGGLNLLKKQLMMPEKISHNDKNYRTLNNYFYKCIMQNILDIPQSAIDEIKNPSDGLLDTEVSPSTLGIATKKYDSSTTCQQYYNTGESVSVQDAMTNLI